MTLWKVKYTELENKFSGPLYRHTKFEWNPSNSFNYLKMKLSFMVEPPLIIYHTKGISLNSWKDNEFIL